MEFNIRLLPVILVIIGLIYVQPAWSNVAFYHFGIENGLTESRVIAIGQDSSGFIWIAGENSLFRFDGSQFKNYRNESNREPALQNGKINCFFTDSRGIFRVGAEMGFYSYHQTTDRFLGPEKNWETVLVTEITEDTKGRLWLATDEGLACFDPETLQTEWFSSPDSVKSPERVILQSGDIKHIAVQPDGKVWIASRYGGLSLLDPENLTLTDFSVINQIEIGKLDISKLHFQNNQLYIGTLSMGFFIYNPKHNVLRNLDFNHLGYTIHSFTPEADSIIWLASNNGLIQFNLFSEEFRFYTNEPLNPLSLSRTAISLVFTDNEKNIWISNGIKGIDYGLTNVPFYHFEVAQNGFNQLENKEVTSINFDKTGNMWIGYEAGFIEKMNPNTSSKTTYYVEKNNQRITQGSIMAIYTDKKGELWAGGWQTGLQRFNREKNRFEFAKVNNKPLNEMLAVADIRGITEDDSRKIWISLHGTGLGCYDPETLQLSIFRFNETRPEAGLSNNYTYDLCICGNQSLWISTAYGLTRYHLKNGTFQSFFNIENDSLSLSSNAVNTVHCDRAGNIWVGTSNGLNLWLPESGKFQRIITANDIPSFNVAAILSVKPGEVWVSYGAGIVQVTITQKDKSGIVNSTFRVFGRSHGLLSSSYFHRSAAVNPSGMMYFGGNESIEYFNPSEASRMKRFASQPMITEITIDGKKLNKKNQTGTGDHQSVLIYPSDRMISIRFTKISFNDFRIKKFRYKLEGYNDDWIYPQNEQVVTFSSLPPGKYRFLLEVQESGKPWTGLKTPLQLTVRPPFWMTWPFILITTISVFSLGYIYHRQKSKIILKRQHELESLIEIRTAELVRKNSELEAVNQTKNKFFSIISHDLRSPFSGFLGILELLNDPGNGIQPQQQKDLLYHASVSAKNTFELLETLLTWARSQMTETVSKPGFHNISLIIEKNIELKSTAAAGKQITFIKNLPENINAFFDPDMINTVVRNILNNAIKFNQPGGLIHVSVINDDQQVIVEIADNGIGMTDSELKGLFDIGKTVKTGTLGEKGTGLGLIICKEFIDKNNGKIWVSQNQPRGTMFHFSLPTS